MKYVRTWIALSLLTLCGITGMLPTSALAATFQTTSSGTSFTTAPQTVTLRAINVPGGTKWIFFYYTKPGQTTSTLINSSGVMSPSYAYSWKISTPGTSYSVYAIARNSSNVTIGQSQAVTIVVNAPPKINTFSTTPAATQLITTGTPITLNANITDDGPQTTVVFSSNGNQVGQTVAAPPGYSATWTPTAGGDYTLKVTAADILNASSSSTLGIKIIDPPTVALVDASGTPIPSPIGKDPTDPTNDKTLRANAGVSSADASLNWSVQRVDYYLLDPNNGSIIQNLGGATVAPYAVPWDPAQGKYFVQAVVTAADTSGHTLTAMSNVVNYVTTTIHTFGVWNPVVAASTAGPNDPSKPCVIRLRTYYDPSHKPTDGYHPMLVIHGGVWVVGKEWTTATVEDPNTRDDSDYDAAIQYFTSQGYQINTISYRLLKSNLADDNDGQQSGCSLVSTDDQINDVKQAYHDTNAFNWGWDAIWGPDLTINQNDRLVILGEENGAQLALRLVNGLPPEEMKRIAVVSISGILDFMDFSLLRKSMYNIRMDVDGPSPRTSIPQTRVLGVGGISIPSGGDCTPYCWIFPSVLNRYYANSAVVENVSQTSGNFGDADLGDPFILQNTFRLFSKPVPDQSIPPTNVRPPIYLVTGNNDASLPPEQSINYCDSLGAPTLYSADNQPDHILFTCGIRDCVGAEPSEIDVPISGDRSDYVNFQELNDPQHVASKTIQCEAASDTKPKSKLDIALDAGHVGMWLPPANLFDRINSWLSQRNIRCINPAACP